MTFLALANLAAECRATDRPITIVDLQLNRTAFSSRIKGAGGKEGVAALVNLNPVINAWFLLRIDWGAGVPEETYHLQNPDPRRQVLLLQQTNPPDIVIARGNARTACNLWSAAGREALQHASRSAIPYAPLCEGRIYLRNPTRGHQTPLEAVTDLLRTNVPGGENVVSFVRDTFFATLYRRKAEGNVESRLVEGQQPRQADAPAPALVDPKSTGHAVKPVDLGIEIEGLVSGSIVPGAWYAAKDNPGIFVSVITPDRIAPEILRSYPQRVDSLGTVESGQLVYLVAFDLLRFDLHYALGTTHPGVGWSNHIKSRMKDTSLPGPDGIATSAPLVRTGLIDPTDARRAVASFTGGFKRYHGAFKYGPLALKNHGSHYGFVEAGVLFSSLQPELATLYVRDDGRAGMKTWTAEDNHDLLPKLGYALQNGVPVIANFDDAGQISIPGHLVNRWGEGNWGGTADLRLQAMRAGTALQETSGGRYLLYAFFWSATPSAMARVFQAYHCRYGMLLEMNALEHTYLAVYKRLGADLSVQHLIRKMSDVDMTVKGKYLPRFLGYPDDRDFFYLTRRDAP